MAANPPPQSLHSQAKRTSFTNFVGNNASILLDRTKAGIRGSTPDSEALASSDDEHDQLHRLQTVTSNPCPKPARRSSWFTDGQSGSTRKPSIGGSGPFSPVSPGTAITSSDQAPWTAVGPTASSTLGRGHASNSSFPWGNTIWNSETQKPSQQRMNEVLPSPTSVVPPGSAPLPQDENPLRSPSLGRDHTADPSIPFSIPLQPTLKSYRSQSYSVGQIDPDSASNQTSTIGNLNLHSSSKWGPPYSGIHHRPSRPGLLGDTTHDPSTLGQLREVDDDEEPSFAPTKSSKAYAGDPRTFEDLAGENAMLRQQLVANQLQQNRITRASKQNQRQVPSQYYHQRIQDNVRDESPTIPTEFEEQRHFGNQRSSGSLGRRFSEYGTSSGPHYALGVSNDQKPVDHIRRSQWHSSLGFARAEDPPQSRRHSFAEMPTRHNSFGSNGDDGISRPLADFNISSRDQNENAEAFSDTASRLSQGDNLNYFSRTNPSPRNVADVQSLSSTTLHHSFAQGQYPRSQTFGQAQGRPSQLLYIVTFKCLRADVFYVQEGTGLRIKKGDLVIVEADRGTDLGTVQSDAVTWSDAKQMKEGFTKRHHEWLMAFSQHTQNGSVAGPNPNGPALTQNSPAMGNAAGFQDLPSGEIKPKMIKRLAQNHEVSTLRDKEGGEAKAKRMCQQKVVDHRLNMEILDAEFQMDWKKLTFFYFADAYINFNPLVTDLFKIYKTRIWMSAINTAAIASPHTGPRPPGLTSRCPAHDYDDYRPGQYSQSATGASGHTPITAFNGLYDSSRMVGGMGYDHIYPQPLQPQGFESRQMSPFPIDYRSPSQQAIGVPTQYGQAATFAQPNLHHAASFGSQHESGPGVSADRHATSRDWNPAFQGMSLGR